MGNLLTPLDLVIFFGSLLTVMGVGLWAGRKEDDAQDFYLAGKQTRWWGVAASIFGSNVSANHLVGMMGVGYAVGFAQSHFEITAIAGLLVLCYGFLPVYRKLNVYTLSEYLERRYGNSSRLVYAMIMVVIMVVIQMVPGFYIGSRSLNILLRDGDTATAKLSVSDAGEISDLSLLRPGAKYAEAPNVKIDSPVDESKQTIGAGAEATATVEDGKVSALQITASGSGYRADNPPTVRLVGGASFDTRLSPGDVNPKWYVYGILMMAFVTGTYTILGGLKAVIVTDVIQSLLLLGAGLLLAFFTFSQPEVGGWSGMLALDRAMPRDVQRMHLYNPINHPQLPWTGVLTGLMVLHFYYWGANQFIAQRALSARSDAEARRGIVVAGFFKLLIPFFSIGCGVAAYFYFREHQKLELVAQDAVFIELLTALVAPVGFGLVGLVAAGMVGAILSSLDSMMNSAATIMTFDIYQRYIKPDASEKGLILVGRLCIVFFVVGVPLLTIFTMDPNSQDSFFLQIADHQGRLVAGVVVAFGLGMLWNRASSLGALVAMLSGVGLSYAIPPLYKAYLGTNPRIAEVFGTELNFFHAVFVAAIAALLIHIVISLLSEPDPERAKLTWTGLGIFTPSGLLTSLAMIGLSLLLFAVLGYLMATERLSPSTCAWSGALWTFCIIQLAAITSIVRDPEKFFTLGTLVDDDRFWGGLLASMAVFMMYWFY